MSEDIPFNRVLNLVPGVVDEVAPGVRRILVDNPSPFTFKGTLSHTANHMAFALKGTDVLFSGDHVMGWSTSIVAPPDGAMSDYMASLERLAARPETIYLAGHGDVIRDAPDFVARYIAHRRGR